MVNAGERGSDQAKPPEKGNGVKDAEKKQRLSGSIEQKFRELRELERQLQDDDARRKRALAKEAKAAERKKDRELLVSAKEFCRELAVNWPRQRSKAVVVSEAELLKLGGVKKSVWYKNGLQLRITFGGEGETQLIFTPSNGAWKIELEGNLSLEELKRDLGKAGRNLWNAAEQKPDIAFQAVEALLFCYGEFKGLPKNEQQKAQVHFAILATLEALERDAKTKARRLQLAFKLLTDNNQWQSQIGKLRDHLRTLAIELQRPPYKLELRKNFDPQQRVQTSNFTTLLRVAGLGWLPTKPRTRV